MNWRELLFVAGFGLAPVGIWFWRMDPLLERHSAALQAQIEARMAESSARKFVHERDQMQAEWVEFRPLAELELENISNQLNPIVLQNRVLDLARRLDCSLRIEERNNDDEEGPNIFQISGSGTPLQVLDLLRHLERGEHRARFTEVTLVYEELSAESGYEAFFNGAFSIPSLPDWEDSEIASMLGADEVDEDADTTGDESEEVSS